MNVFQTFDKLDWFLLIFGAYGFGTFLFHILAWMIRRFISLCEEHQQKKLWRRKKTYRLGSSQNPIGRGFRY